MQSHGEQYRRFDLTQTWEIHNTFQSDCIRPFTKSIQPLNPTIKLKQQMNK